MLETNYKNKICFFDLESTGLDLENDRITQIAWCICDLDSQDILSVGMRYMYDTDYPPVTDEITELTGITEALLKHAGIGPAGALLTFVSELEKQDVKYICAHNYKGFDGPMLKKEFERMNIKWTQPIEIDTKVDLDFPPSMKARGLLCISAEHGFLPYQSHDALFDTLTLRKLFFSYDWQQTARNAATPTISIHISTNYDTRDEAKKRGYYYESNTKRWLKDIKENKLGEEIDKAKPFQITVI